MHELILGGARSGKSLLAERLAESSGLECVYVATATAGDSEMCDRINHHQRRRGPHWQLVEEPLKLAEALQRHCHEDRYILVDCLTLWLSNILLSEPPCFENERAALLDCLPQLPGRVLIVSNETGLGVVPMNQLSRQFCDEAGRLHQELAAHCDRVIFTVAGLPQVLKGPALPTKPTRA